jgi:hypothetical protein
LYIFVENIIKWNDRGTLGLTTGNVNGKVTLPAEKNKQIWYDRGNFYIILDACDYEFSVGIENLPYNKVLLDYEFGKEEHFNLKNRLHCKLKKTNKNLK